MYSSAFLTICIHELDYIPMIYENGFKKKTFFSWRDDEARESTYNMLSIVIIAIRFEVDA